MSNSIEFIPLTSDHYPLLVKWLNTPHVWIWWGEGQVWSLETIEAKHQARPVYAFIALLDGRPVGYFQYYRASELPREGAGLDFYIGEVDCLRKGLGTEALTLFLQTHVFKDFAFCIVDPDAQNAAAIRTYEKVGFTLYSKVEEFLIMLKSRPLC